MATRWSEPTLVALVGLTIVGSCVLGSAPGAALSAPASLAGDDERRIAAGEEAVEEGTPLAVGDVTVIVMDADIRGRRDGKEIWHVAGPAQSAYALLAGGGGVAYLQRWAATENPGPNEPEYSLPNPARLERLSVADGQWLAPIEVPAAAEADQQVGAPVAALADDDGIVLLAPIRKPPGEDWFQPPVAWSLSRFGREKLVWSRTLPVEQVDQRPGAMLLGPMRAPDRAEPAVRPLVRVGKRLLVTPGGTEPIRAVAWGSGRTQWTLERVWEFERGFIGPSVWSYYLSRFGEDHFGREEKPDAKRRERSDALAQRARMIAGPIAVPHERGHRVFVATIRASDTMGGYVSTCQVYELTSDGRPYAVIDTPRTVDGTVASVTRGGVVWGCTGGALLRMEPSEQVTGGMGPGGTDLLARMAWYRQPGIEGGPYWLSLPNGGGLTAISDDRVVIAAERGYVRAEGAIEVEVPLLGLDTLAGSEHRATLVVPLPRPAALPETNYRGGGGSTDSLAGHLVGIGGIRFEGDDIVVGVWRAPETTRQLRFPASELFR